MSRPRRASSRRIVDDDSISEEETYSEREEEEEEPPVEGAPGSRRRRLGKGAVNHQHSMTHTEPLPMPLDISSMAHDGVQPSIDILCLLACMQLQSTRTMTTTCLGQETMQQKNKRRKRPVICRKMPRSTQPDHLEGGLHLAGVGRAGQVPPSGSAPRPLHTKPMAHPTSLSPRY